MEVNTTNLSLLQLIRTFETWADKHAQINAFGQGFEDELLSNTVLEYPLLWISVLPSVIQEKTIQYNFRVIVMDLVDTDKRNSLDVLSDSLQIIWDLIMSLSDQYNLDIVINGNATPFEEYKDDRLSGHYIDIGVTVPYVLGACDVPLTKC